MTTTYTIHCAKSNAVVLSFGLDCDTRKVLVRLANAHDGRFYIHNGVGVVSAVRCSEGEAHNISRDSFILRRVAGQEARTIAKIAN